MDSTSPEGTVPERLSIRGTIEPTRLSAAYRFGLVVVAIAMLLLPIVYLGLIALAGAGVWWHLSSNAWLVTGRSAGFWRLLAYIAPAVAGVIVIFFMVKPVLARPRRPQDSIQVTRDTEPVLFDFIDQICHQVRAPVPARVQVDCQINASAGFLPGRFGPLRRELVLTIGLPLAAGLSVRELGGVLAHEFGHFAQGGGMQLTALVRGINAWFGRVVYERDQWDETLDSWLRSADIDWRLSSTLYLARAAIWASRRVLTGLMIAGHAISCFMLRQMEYDADSYEAKFAGSAAFARTSVRMRELGVAAQFGYHDLRQGWLGRTLPSNLPAFLIAQSGRLPDEVLTHVRAGPDRTTGVFDTHPSDADRVTAAETLAAPGVLVGGDGPGTGLFRDFDGLSATATRHHYEHDLGLSLETATLVEIDAALRESNSRQESEKATQSFFGERTSGYRLLRVALNEVEHLGAPELALALGAARDAMAVDAGTAEKYRRFEALETTRAQTFGAQQVLGAGFDKVDAGDFGLIEGTLEDAIATEARAAEQQHELVQDLDAFEAVVSRRLACSVTLLARTSPAHGNLLAEAIALVRALNAMSSVQADLAELRRLSLAESLLVHNQAASTKQDQMRTRIAHVGQATAARLAKVRAGLDDVPCPEVMSPAPTTVAAWCGLSADGLTVSIEEMGERSLTVYWGTLGRLAAIALQVEGTVAPITAAACQAPGAIDPDAAALG
jgi:Zn-dependent protease with chaperone function